MAEDELNSALLMFIAYRHAENTIFEALAKQGYDDLTLPQARFCARVSNEGSRLTELAEAAQVTKQAAGYLVDQLERTGYVERVPDPTDARARLVRLSRRGVDAQQAAGRVEQQIEDEWTAHLGPRRMKAMREGLAALREITDPFR